MSGLGLNFYPPTIYFNNINFNNDFYAIPNNNQGISLAYANTHFLFSTGVANSTATSTFFSGSVGIGAIASGLAGDINALRFLLNGNDISNIYQPKINTYNITGATGGSLSYGSGILTLSMPTTYTSLAIASLTSSTSIIYKGAEISSTYQPLLSASTNLLGYGSNITNLNYNNITLNKPDLNLYVPFTALASSNYITNATSGLTNYYNKTSIDSFLATKEAVLTFNAPLSRTLNAINIDLTNYYNKIEVNNISNFDSNYTTQCSNNNSNFTYNSSNILNSKINNYLVSSGGSLTGDLNTNSKFLTTNNLNVGIPTVSTTGTGDKLIFTNGGTNFYPNSIGLENAGSLWMSACNLLKFYNNGINSMTIQQNGAVGIGTTANLNNASYKLDVRGDIIGTTISSVDNNKNWVGTISTLTSGETYIQTAGLYLSYCPDLKIQPNFGNLYLGNSGLNSNVYINGSNLGIRTPNASNIVQVGGGGRLRIANTIADYTLIGTADTDGTTNSRIVISGNTRTGGLGQIEYVSTNTGGHIFYTSASTERMRILTGGNIGINNTNPQALLHLGNVSGVSDGFIILSKNNGAGGIYNARFGFDSAFNIAIGGYGNSATPVLTDWTKAFYMAYNAPANSLTINSSGCVGIGVASASSGINLEVVGQLRVLETSNYPKEVQVLIVVILLLIIKLEIVLGMLVGIILLVERIIYNYKQTQHMLLDIMRMEI
jgi:hypothetical protein